jgi:hypothetical protein
MIVGKKIMDRQIPKGFLRSLLERLHGISSGAVWNQLIVDTSWSSAVRIETVDAFERSNELKGAKRLCFWNAWATRDKLHHLWQKHFSVHQLVHLRCCEEEENLRVLSGSYIFDG